MLWWILQVTLISFLLIFLVHHLFEFFKTTLTVPKVKDLVNAPKQRYEHMYNTIRNAPQSLGTEDYTLIDLLPPAVEEKSNMKNELKHFLKSQLQT
jgi:hypothetical protein